MKTTKAAILSKIGEPLQIEEIELPDLKEGQVLVKVLYSGLCRSQINEIKGNKGEDKYLPHTLGHEGSGIIEEVGSGVTKVKKGDNVVLTWISSKGLNEPSCQYKQGEKIINSGAVSTFLQYAVISENKVVPINENLPKDVAALLGCAIPTGGGIIKNDMSLSSENSLAIFGLGGIGSSALLQALALECKNIIVVDVNASKLNFAKDLGAHYTINPINENVIEKIKTLTENKGADFALECSGVKSVMETAFQSIKNNGKVVIAGNLKQGETISLDPFDLIKGKTIVGTWGGSTKPDYDIPYYITQYEQNKLPLKTLITKIYSLSQINEAIKDLEDGVVVRALINCQE